MEMVSPQQRQAVSNEVQAALQMLVKTDLKLYGKVSTETLEAVQIQGFVLQNGTIQKTKSTRAETVQCEQEAATISTKEKPSVRGQLRNASKEMGQCLHPEGRSKGSEAR